jgi:hypothetical protein
LQREEPGLALAGLDVRDVAATQTEINSHVRLSPLLGDTPITNSRSQIYEKAVLSSGHSPRVELGSTCSCLACQTFVPLN